MCELVLEFCFKSEHNPTFVELEAFESGMIFEFGDELNSNQT